VKPLMILTFIGGMDIAVRISLRAGHWVAQRLQASPALDEIAA